MTPAVARGLVPPNGEAAIQAAVRGERRCAAARDPERAGGTPRREVRGLKRAFQGPIRWPAISARPALASLARQR